MCRLQKITTHSTKIMRKRCNCLETSCPDPTWTTKAPHEKTEELIKKYEVQERNTARHAHEAFINKLERVLKVHAPASPTVPRRAQQEENLKQRKTGNPHALFQLMDRSQKTQHSIGSLMNPSSPLERVLQRIQKEMPGVVHQPEKKRPCWPKRKTEYTENFFVLEEVSAPACPLKKNVKLLSYPRFAGMAGIRRSEYQDIYRPKVPTRHFNVALYRQSH
ncbi:uncharacterized protein LOC108279178 [Ictalurus punctatus]|uniref:Uncharacterized protein LOC108279178 n=1 Tax=Ictalurus punctatus TaxID=7998 RepID=A0A2D0T1A5_ICTPU|nr:uncharacterized protein LOC108279178 [Ictalurus punctatus]XP_053543753.1 uncharacterized protein LOC108279178 [Ictalurus punctatus]